jgi:hypothetical protein
VAERLRGEVAATSLVVPAVNIAPLEFDPALETAQIG